MSIKIFIPVGMLKINKAANFKVRLNLKTQTFASEFPLLQERFGSMGFRVSGELSSSYTTKNAESYLY